MSPTQDSAAATAQAQPLLNTSLATRYSLTGRGAWTGRDRGGVHTTYTVDRRDGYQQVGSSPWTYDAAGALVQDATTQFRYDALGQLASSSTATVGRAYRRDALGRIIAETDTKTGAVTRYAYDGLRRTFRRTPDGQVDVTIDGAGLDEHVVTITASGQRRYLHQDRLGSVQLITNEVGNPLEWIRYTAFGEPTIKNSTGSYTLPTSAVGNRFGFHDHPQDWAAGLVDMRARAYRPAFGRFLSLDPMGLAAGSPNLYALGDGAALTFVDPLGLRKENDSFEARLDAEFAGAPANAQLAYGLGACSR